MAPGWSRAGMAALVGIGVAVSACGGTDTGTSAAGAGSPEAGAGARVAVTLQEWAVVPAPASVAAGSVTFTVTNGGPDDVHEFVILRTDLDPGALPTDATGTVTEDAAGIEVVDEIEDIPVGETQEVSATLTAGSYVLLCNIYSQDEQEAHYAMGMRVGFAVTE